MVHITIPPHLITATLSYYKRPTPLLGTTWYHLVPLRLAKWYSWFNVGYSTFRAHGTRYHLKMKIEVYRGRVWKRATSSPPPPRSQGWYRWYRGTPNRNRNPGGVGCRTTRGSFARQSSSVPLRCDCRYCQCGVSALCSFLLLCTRIRYDVANS